MLYCQSYIPFLSNVCFLVTTSQYCRKFQVPDKNVRWNDGMIFPDHLTTFPKGDNSFKNNEVKSYCSCALCSCSMKFIIYFLSYVPDKYLEICSVKKCGMDDWTDGQRPIPHHISRGESETCL